MVDHVDEKIAIVGGGITGLFCSLVLNRRNKSFDLFEASGRLGGRIRTIRLDKDNIEFKKGEWSRKKLEFYAEFGPMRIELDKQLLLKSLLDYLSIEPKPVTGADGNSPYLERFPAYASPPSIDDPQYKLPPEEADKAPLQLLRMALLRIIVHLVVEPNTSFANKQKKLKEEIMLASAIQEAVDPIFARWMRELTEEHYWEIQTQGRIADVPLYTMGFWNLLSDYLSHDAITKLRDLGTFYHLLPENPNAAEWLVWWLLGFATSEQLQGISGGMECIVDTLESKLDRSKLHTDCLITGLQRSASNKLKLIFSKGSKIDEINPDEEYDHVILALPKNPLNGIVHQSKDAFESEPEISGLLNSAFAFPMVKMFVVVKNRWWEEDNRANRYATRVPTRELHYWKGRTEDSKQGLIMAYTDRPASSFWANYVPQGSQDDVHRSEYNVARSGGNSLPKILEDRLVRKVVQYINENEVPEITPADIAWYGIRDWGRDPYGGANHAWRPGRKYWVAMRRLAEIGQGTGSSRIYICGEAYSDYHGFMEGSLRSAVYVLHRLLDKNADKSFSSLPWLLSTAPGTDETELRVEENYLEDLRKWVKRLDQINSSDPFVRRE
jgi:hypothetical protein